MDSDDEELEAKKKVNGVDKKKTADEMFEELGYGLEYEDEISFTLANRKKHDL